MKEEWKPISIKEYSKLYEISNLGNVQSVDRVTGNRKFCGSHIKPFKDRAGYLQVNLKISKNIKSCRVHRLVGESFINNPKNKPDINHIDGNKSNNNVSNLEWVTKSENTKHALANGLMHPKRGEQSPVSKLTEQDVLFIKINPYKLSNYAIARVLGISDAQVHRIYRNKGWTHINV